jgi:hypothetical protein
MGVIEIIVIITIEAIISRHIVDIERHDISRLLFDFKLHSFRTFGNILQSIIISYYFYSYLRYSLHIIVYENLTK